MAIWFSRNQRIFDGRNTSEQETITKAISDAREWALAQIESTKKTEQAAGTRPPPISSPEIIQNMDGAGNEEKQLAGID